MNEVDTPVADTTEPEVVEQPVEQTLAEHEQTYGKNGNQAKAPVVVDPEAEPIKAHPATGQKRADDGTFVEGKSKKRGKDAVSRIGELTGRAKTAEERVASLEAEVDRLKRSGASAAVIAKAEANVDAADPEPSEHDPVFGGDYLKFLDARARWNARSEFQTLRQKETDARAQAQASFQHQEFTKTLQGRWDDAKVRIPNFEAVVSKPAPWLDAKTAEPLPNGAGIDAVIMEDEHGLDVLHYLHSHPEETDALLRMSSFQQLKTLALLTQRFASNGSETAGVTRSAAGPKVAQPPRPPNLVRTEAQRAPNAPPTGELSLAEHEKHFGKRR